MKKVKDLFKTIESKMENILLPNKHNENDELAKKNGFNDYVASAILLILSVLIGIKFKTVLLAQFESIFTWFGTGINTLTSSN